MDKSWMETNRISKSYVDGVAAFTDYAVHNLQKTGNIDPRVNKKHIYIPCPCTKCLNHIEHKVEEVQYHLYRHGIDISYTKWTKHGEEDEPSISAPKPVNATTEFVDDMDFAYIPTDGPATVEMVNATKDNFDVDDLVKFQELLLDAEKPLYEGCPDFTKLSAIVKLLNLKGKYGASDKFFTELLGLIKKMLPAGNEMVEKTYQAKKVMRLMGSGYKKIHVCINNCLLYWKNDKDLTACRTCGTSRWKVDNKTKKVYENIPAKVMWYFPIIPRLQRLFKIESISEDLRWHATRRITDGVLRHPADSQAWRTIDEKFPEIAEDTRNLRLGISADGVDVNTGNRHHSVWPVLTVIYNLPPWLCMKRKFINLSVLISGYPGNDIDVFLEPLVDDLHTLFETGVDTYDASTKDNFNLRAVVLWTINDYPALGTLCGCPYSGFKGCVVCGKDTNCVRLSTLSKQSYVGHRRYLPYNHPFRKQKKAFNGQQEFLLDPNLMTGEQIYNEVQHIENKWGKGKRTTIRHRNTNKISRGRGGKIQKQKRNIIEEESSSSQVNEQNGVYWKKFNIWYRKLRYWRHNSVPHCIDF
ncbi:putative transposase-associated domain-containing protein [Tanacetum coccineum]